MSQEPPPTPLRPLSLPRPGRRRRGWPRRVLAALVVCDVLLLTLACQVHQVGVEYADERLVVGQWQDLDARGWTEATTGYRAPGQSDLPQVDAAYGGGL